MYDTIIDKLKAVQSEMIAQIDEARRALRQLPEDEVIRHRAEMYWLPNIEGSVWEGGDSLQSTMVTLEDTVKELEDVAAQEADEERENEEEDE